MTTTTIQCPISNTHALIHDDAPAPSHGRVRDERLALHRAAVTRTEREVSALAEQPPGRPRNGADDGSISRATAKDSPTTRSSQMTTTTIHCPTSNTHALTQGDAPAPSHGPVRDELLALHSEAVTRAEKEVSDSNCRSHSSSWG
jgi:hypothetical protein